MSYYARNPWTDPLPPRNDSSRSHCSTMAETLALCRQSWIDETAARIQRLTDQLADQSLPKWRREIITAELRLDTDRLDRLLGRQLIAAE